jgi:hypothetical protein
MRQLSFLGVTNDPSMVTTADENDVRSQQGIRETSDRNRQAVTLSVTV